MNEKSADDGLAVRWAPVVVAALTGGVVVAAAEGRIALASAVGLAVVVGLAAGALVWGALRLLRRSAR